MRFPMDMEIILRAQHDGNFVGFVTHGDEAVWTMGSNWRRSTTRQQRQDDERAEGSQEKTDAKTW